MHPDAIQPCQNECHSTAQQAGSEAGTPAEQLSAVKKYIGRARYLTQILKRVCDDSPNAQTMIIELSVGVIDKDGRPDFILEVKLTQDERAVVEYAVLTALSEMMLAKGERAIELIGSFLKSEAGNVVSD